MIVIMIRSTWSVFYSPNYVDFTFLKNYLLLSSWTIELRPNGISVFCHSSVNFRTHSCAYPHSLPLTPTHSRTCWCTNIDGRMTKVGLVSIQRSISVKVTVWALKLISKVSQHLSRRYVVLESAEIFSQTHKRVYLLGAAFSWGVVIWNTQERTRTMSHHLVSSTAYSAHSTTSRVSQWEAAAINFDQSENSVGRIRSVRSALMNLDGWSNIASNFTVRRA